MQIASIIVSIAASLISGAVLFFLKRYFNKRDEKDRKVDERRHAMSVLTLKSINAVGKLTEANAIALRDGKTNGEMHAAMEEYSKVNKELYDFLFDQASNKN